MSLMPTATPTDPPPAYSHTMHSKPNYKDPATPKIYIYFSKPKKINIYSNFAILGLLSNDYIKKNQSFSVDPWI